MSDTNIEYRLRLEIMDLNRRIVLQEESSAENGKILEALLRIDTQILEGAGARVMNPTTRIRSPQRQRNGSTS